MRKMYDKHSPSNLISLNINSDLLKQAKELDINLSILLEQALINRLNTKQAHFWIEQNKNAISAYNKSVDENGTFSGTIRSF